MKGGQGLTKVPTAELETVLRWLHRGEMKPPLTRSFCLSSALPYLGENGDLVFGLDETALRAVLVAVISERRAKKA